ncbi:MAG: 23S rRNA (cytidine(2498)-2'-O)-methyltransferase RlmM [Gammaproteobacteria bacterium]|nr:23S rRNA (cytidine(2498)-2'-O)-methyltransferase RlmM [Gammaproteobacteria bacterium]
MQFLFLYCRSGFENECAAEIQDLAVQVGVAGYCKAKQQAGYVTFHPYEAPHSKELVEKLDFRALTFARQWFVALDLRNDLPLNDRISPLLESLAEIPEQACRVSYEHLDTNDGKALSALCNSIEKPFNSALIQGGFLRQQQACDGLRIHICFLSTAAAAIGYSPLSNSSPWAMGIPRLRLPKSAPSRATLKLDEAFLTFMDERERNQKLRSGMSAIDLGAAPGGWTWQLARYNMHIIAVDNGNMDQKLLDTGLITHLREDGFRYRPDKTVDWMVCDIVEQPIKVATMVAKWLTNRWCHATVFNLKLPMKKRYQELRLCLDTIEHALHENGVAFRMLCKQLYHDREEVTVFVELKV